MFIPISVFLLKLLISPNVLVFLYLIRNYPLLLKCIKSSVTASVSVQSPFSNIYFWCWQTWFSCTLCRKVFFHFSRKNIIAQTIPRIQRRYSISLNFCKDSCSPGIFLQNTYFAFSTPIPHISPMNVLIKYSVKYAYL